MQLPRLLTLRVELDYLVSLRAEQKRFSLSLSHVFFSFYTFLESYYAKDGYAHAIEERIEFSDEFQLFIRCKQENFVITGRFESQVKACARRLRG